MTRVCHLFDGSIGWQERVGASQLVDRLDRAAFDQRLATVDPVAVGRLTPIGRDVAIVARSTRVAALAAPQLRRHLRRHEVDIVHAWGVRAAHIASGAGYPFVLELFDPDTAAKQVKAIRTFARPGEFAVACAAETVRRRLLEGGLPASRCAVIRPGVGFRSINAFRRGSLRRDLGITDEAFLIALSDPPVRGDGSFDAFWAGKLLSFLDGGVRVAVTGDEREKSRIRRFDAAHLGEPTFVGVSPEMAFEELIAVSDALVVAARGDVPATAIAWAMAAKTAVIGSAVHSVAELISHKLNGLLFKQRPGKSMAVAIIRCLQDREAQAKAAEVAHGHAYEVFGVRRFVDQHARLYENMLSGVHASEGIQDSAVSA